jgi:hypothetical protein
MVTYLNGMQEKVNALWQLRSPEGDAAQSATEEELDAYCVRLYGLTRAELRDPKEVYGEDFTGETFRC